MLKILYALELIGVCNLRCSYCPYGKMARDRGVMHQETFLQVLNLMKAKAFTCDMPLHLHLFGEPMISSKFEDMAIEIKKIWPFLSFSTNGHFIDEARAQGLKKIGFQWITVSPHDPPMAFEAYKTLRDAGCNVMLQGGPDHNWAGQVENEVTWGTECEFERHNKFVIRWNGDVALCCITDSEQGVVGTIWDKDVFETEHTAFPLCHTCHEDRRSYAEMSVLQRAMSS